MNDVSHLMRHWSLVKLAGQGEAEMVVLDSQDSIGGGLHRRLRDDIIFGRFAPGSKLRLEQLRKHYDVSITTLREALPRLVSDGLIHFEPAKGFEVAAISARELREISDMRLLLEQHAIAQSFAKGGLDWEASVLAAHHKLSRMETRMLSGDRSVSEAWKRYDREFHAALISACGSPELLAAHDRIFDRFLRYQVLLVMFRGKEASDEHDALMAAALDHDADRAQRLLVQHIGACIDYTVAHGLLEDAQ